MRIRGCNYSNYNCNYNTGVITAAAAAAAAAATPSRAGFVSGGTVRGEKRALIFVIRAAVSVRSETTATKHVAANEAPEGTRGNVRRTRAGPWVLARTEQISKGFFAAGIASRVMPTGTDEKRRGVKEETPTSPGRATQLLSVSRLGGRSSVGDRSWSDAGWSCVQWDARTVS